MPKHSEDAETRMTMAALTAALVRALSDENPGLADRFCQHLETTYNSMRDYESEPSGVMETLKWTHDFVKVSRE